MQINNEFADEIIYSPFFYIWKIYRKKTVSNFAMWTCFVFLLLTIFSSVIAPLSPNLQNLDKLLLPPYWTDGGNLNYFLGTDDLGRDLFSRILYGIKFTFGGALIITISVCFLGTIIGAGAAITKGYQASLLHHILDIFLTLPTLLIALLLIIIFEPSYWNCIFAVFSSLLSQFIREIYQIFKTELNKPYIVALSLDGASTLRQLSLSVFPNILEPITPLLARILTLAIIEISTLGFIGIGAQLPQIELGALISDNLELIYISPWTVLFPGLTIFIVVLSINVFAEGLRSAILEGEE